MERGRLGSTNCQYNVPCPHCGTYQSLRMGAKDESGIYDLKQPGRLEWDKTPSGKSDKETARRHLHDLVLVGLLKIEKPVQKAIYLPSDKLLELAGKVFLDKHPPKEALRKLFPRHNNIIQEERKEEERDKAGAGVV